MIDNGDALNLSTGVATSFHDFALMATSILNYYPNIVGDSSKPSGVTSRVGNTDKQISYNFKTKITFEEGIKECINYFCNLKTK
jgi:GDP-L-fucose synthase